MRLDADTSMSPGTFEAALRAAGGAIKAVDEVLTKRAVNAFVATRPPGHHAETARPMGFLPVRQRCNRRPLRTATSRYRPRSDRRFRCPSRQRLAGIFWADKSGDVLLDPPNAAVSRHRRRHRSGEHDTIVNAPLRPGEAPEHSTPHSRAGYCRDLPIFGQSSSSSLPASTPTSAIRSPISTSRKRICLGNA